MKTIGEATVETYQAFLENARWQYRNCVPDHEAHWHRRILAYEAVISALKVSQEMDALPLD